MDHHPSSTPSMGMGTSSCNLYMPNQIPAYSNLPSQSANHNYMPPHDSLSPKSAAYEHRIRTLQQELIHKDRELASMAAHNQQLFHTNTSLLSALQHTQQQQSQAPPPIPVAPPSSKEQPLPPPTDVTKEQQQKEYWFKDAYGDKAGKKAPDGRVFTKAAMLFATDEHGTLPSPELVDEMKASAHAVLLDMGHQGHIRPSATSWLLLGSDAIDIFRARIEFKFPRLRRANAHWKADSIGGYVYQTFSDGRGKEFIDSKPKLSGKQPAAPRTVPQPDVHVPAPATAPKKRKSTSDLNAHRAKRPNADVVDSEVEEDAAMVPIVEQLPQKKEEKQTKQKEAKAKAVESLTYGKPMVPAPRPKAVSNSRAPAKRLPPISAAVAPKPKKAAPTSTTNAVASSSRKQLTPEPRDMEDDTDDDLLARMGSDMQLNSPDDTTMPLFPVSDTEMDATDGLEPSIARPAAKQLVPSPPTVPAPVVPKPVGPAPPAKNLAPAKKSANSASTEKQRPKWMDKLSVAEGLCLSEWLPSHPGKKGGEKNFKVYWENLNAQEKMPYFMKADELKAQKTL
ncbi:hypothetical protein MKEN_00599000 [Mycena kentingensis (nom. inval.)]|nr:hypothetical protein MKEN_00599000 [Mycena kentingensis (nom. inval.)]